MNNCPICISPMDIKTGRHGVFYVCTRRSCGYIPTKAELKKNRDAKIAVSKLLSKKRKKNQKKEQVNFIGPVLAKDYDPEKRMAEYGPLHTGSTPPWE